MLKLILKILSVFALFAALVIGAAFFFTADIVSEADRFFAKVANKNIESAYQDTSDAFRQATSLSELEQFFVSSKINQYKQASWSSRSVQNGAGQLLGIITTKDDSEIPLRVEFVKQGGAWKIQGIFLNHQNASKTLPGIPPSNDEAVKMVRSAMKVFGAAVDGRDMRAFHEFISSLWKEQYTIEMLEEAYKPLYDIEARFEVLNNLLPVFDSQPEIAQDGILEISGYYPTNPSRLFFWQRYVMEGGEWKLLGLRVNIRDPQQPAG